MIIFRWPRKCLYGYDTFVLENSHIAQKLFQHRLSEKRQTRKLVEDKIWVIELALLLN